jgi:type VI secretion system protein ImpG
MSETLFPYYERELLFIRQLSQEFARQYPAAAGRLLLEHNRSGDPHIERLIESFALLAGRIHHKIDDEFPELTEGLLGVLYPHYLAPVPSLGVVQFDLDPARAGLPDGFLIPRHSRLKTRPVNGLPCSFRTGYPTTLWPVRLVNARLQSPPFPAGLAVPPRTAAALRLQFECLGGLKFTELSLQKLRFYLSGDTQLMPTLYELLFNHALQVVFRPVEPAAQPSPLVLDPGQCLTPVGFEADDSLLVYPQRSFVGYRLLTEFFAFPAKFMFVDLGGWQQAARAGFTDRLEVVVFLNRAVKGLEQGVDATTFRQGCTPVVNLFEQVAEPIALTQAKHEYRVLPDVAYPLGLEVYSVEAVSATDPITNTTTPFEPFYSFRHGRTAEDQQTFWYASRRKPLDTDDRGTDVYLTLVDLGFNPRQPAESTLVVKTICTNRELPARLQHAGDQVYFELEAAAPLSRVLCLRTPTAPFRPPLRRGSHWRLVSHLCLNHLSLSDPLEGLEALQEILRLYDFSDAEAGQQQQSAVARQLIEGITAMSTRRVVGRTGGGPASGFCRGIEVSIELDEQKYVGTGVYLFAAVLERFLGLYAGLNSFSQLVAKTTQAEGYFKKWPPRAGELPLV